MTIDELNKRITKIVTKHAQNLREPHRKIAVVMERSIRKNFRVGGRPNKWIPSKKLSKPAKAGYGAHTLIGRTRNLMTRLTSYPGKKQLRISNNMIYAPHHHFGGNARTTKAVGFTMPKRPFMLIQDKDVPKIKRIYGKHLMQDFH